MKTNKTSADEAENITIPKLHIKSAVFEIKGTSPYLQNGWTKEAVAKIRSTQEQGSAQSRKRNSKAPRDFKDAHLEAMHCSVDGWPGIPVNAFRNALISACRLAGFKMTHAKLALEIGADGLDERGIGLVRIEGEPTVSEMLVTNTNGGADIRCRPMWKQWSAKVEIKFDADTFTSTDVGNLLYRAGQQVGIGAGRPDSKNSPGLGFGKFAIAL